MGTLDIPTGGTVKRFSKIIDIDGMTRPQVKAALDEFLNKGWILASIYNEAAQTRVVMVRTKDD